MAASDVRRALDLEPAFKYFQPMVVNSARRFVCLFLAAALALATVWMNGGASAGMMGSHRDTTATNGDMMCPACDLMRSGISGCTQMSCISPAVIAESGTFIGAMGQVFFQTAALLPDEMTSAPPTPPI